MNTKYTIILTMGIFLSGCSSNSTQPTTQSNSASSNVGQTSNSSTIQSANTASTTAKNDSMPTVASSHSRDVEKSGGNQSGSSQAETKKPDMPMGQARPVDTSKFDETITKAEKDYKADSKSDAKKEALADAYAARALALTEVAQYRAALGDFRKCLKLNPNHSAKDMHDQILSIFKSLNREPPKEGEEPAPMPFKQDSK